MEGKGFQLSGYYTFNDKGELTQGKGDIDKTVYVYSGNKTLSLGVRTDDDVRYVEWHFDLGADNVPSYTAPIVIGVRADHETTSQKIETPNGLRVDPELVSEFKSVVAKMTSSPA